MRFDKKSVMKTFGSTTLGGALGAGTYSVIGGMGLTAVGTGFGITLGPLVAIGAGLGGAAYGLVWLGKEIGARAKGRGQE